MVQNKSQVASVTGFHLNIATISTLFFFLSLSCRDMLSNRGHGKAFCLVLREEVSKQLVWQSALKAPVYHSDCLIQPKNMGPQRESGFISRPVKFEPTVLIKQ